MVTLQGQGKGGRNQEMALAFLDEMSRWNQDRERVFFLAASTDGNDGPTDAAGAFADQTLLEQSRAESLSIARYLENNDSYAFFRHPWRIVENRADQYECLRPADTPGCLSLFTYCITA